MHGQQNVKIKKMCKTFLILRRIAQDIIKNVYRHLCKVDLILVQF